MLESYYEILSLILGLFLVIGAIKDLYGYKQTGNIKGCFYSMKGSICNNFHIDSRCLFCIITIPIMIKGAIC